MSDDVKRWDIFVHDNTGSEYVVMGIARHPGTLKLIVVYAMRDQEDDSFFWRPLQEFRQMFTKKRGGSTSG